MPCLNSIICDHLLIVALIAKVVVSSIAIVVTSISSEIPIHWGSSIIPTVAKIFEKIIYEQLCEYLNDNNLLSQCQPVFRSLHSTLTALIEATNSWSFNIYNGHGLVNGVIFIDLKKAFDTIDHMFSYGSFIFSVLTGVVSNGLNPIFETELKCSINGHLKYCASFLWRPIV